jgi:hypothetical protein
MSCEGCKDKLIALDDRRNLAKKLAVEKKQAQALCKESDGTLFTVDAVRAFREHFHILEVVSGLPPGA